MVGQWLASGIALLWLGAGVSAGSKRGVCVGPHKGNTRCGDLDQLTNVSWFYDWSMTDDMFTTCPTGKEFIPCLWGDAPILHNSTNTTALSRARFLLSFNEPDNSGQSNVRPHDASLHWPYLVSLAREFDLPLVAPCVTNADGASHWLDEWQSNCTQMYSGGCVFDFSCTHAYYFPTPCPPEVAPWACSSHLLPMVQKLYSRFSKPVFLTEFACRAWGRAQESCSAAENMRLMQQTVPALDASSHIFRYAWFISRAPAAEGDSLLQNATNDLTQLGQLYNDL